MTVRFRIRTPGGQELSFASPESFEEFVRSGDLSPDDLVYDRDTGSWSPARTHPTVLDIQYEQEAADEAATEVPEAGGGGVQHDATEADDAFGLSLTPDQDTVEDEGEGADAEGEEVAAEGEEVAAEGEEVAAVADDDLGLDLSLMEAPTPEEAKRAFVEKLEAERQLDLDDGTSAERIAGFTMEDSSSLGGMLERDRPTPEPEKPRPKPRDEAPARPPAKEKRGGLGRILFMAALLVILGGGGFVGYRLLQAGAEPPSEGVEPTEVVEEPIEVEPPPPAPEPEPVIASTVAAVRERAQERYLAATQSELRDLQPIPEVWPAGPYLSVPTDYPEIVDIWQSYVSTIRAVRETDAERYRTAYQNALDDAAVADETRAPRLEAGMAAFVEMDSLRSAHFGRVEALAVAAIQSHNALVEAEGLILYDQTGSTGRPEGIGEGTSGRDADAQLLLDQVVELLEASLEADGEGPGSGQTVREWVWDGFLDAATARPAPASAPDPGSTGT